MRKKLRIKDTFYIRGGYKDLSYVKEAGKYRFYSGGKEVKRTTGWTYEGEAIVIPNRGAYCGKTIHYVEQGVKFDITTLAVCLICFNKELINTKYVYYWMKVYHYDECVRNGYISTTTVPMLTLESMKNIRFPLERSREEQDKVVAYLDEQMGGLDQLIKGWESKVESAKKLKKSLILKYISNKNADVHGKGWESIRIKNICVLFMGKKYAGEAKKDGEYKFFSGSKVVKRIDTYSQQGPSILLSNGGDCGNIIHLVSDDEKFEISSHSICLKNFQTDLIHVDYLYYWLLANLYDYCQRFGLIKTTTLAMLNLSGIKNISVEIPKDVEVQKSIVSKLKGRVDDIDLYIEKCYLSIEKLKEYKLSKIKETFELK